MVYNSKFEMSPHIIIIDKELAPLLATYNNFLLRVWKTFKYSLKKCAIFESIQKIYSKKLLKIFKIVTTRWLTYGQASKRVLDRFEEILKTLDSICEDTFEPELQCYRADMLEQVNMFTLCLMTNVLGIINFFLLVLHKNANLQTLKLLWKTL